jgi:hypothetical protein
MSELVFRCDYCGRLVPISRATMDYHDAEVLDDERILVLVATFCGTYCAGRSGGLSISKG